MLYVIFQKLVLGSKDEGRAYLPQHRYYHLVSNNIYVCSPLKNRTRFPTSWRVGTDTRGIKILTPILLLLL